MPTGHIAPDSPRPIQRPISDRAGAIFTELEYTSASMAVAGKCQVFSHDLLVWSLQALMIGLRVYTLQKPSVRAGDLPVCGRNVFDIARILRTHLNMPPSQLKKLKASLRESGVVGQQKSKKQKRQAYKNGTPKDGRVQKNAALQSIRQQFNPFEFKPVGYSKHEVTSSATVGGRTGKTSMAKPGITKGLGEENRRKTLLIEMQRRRKVGGIMDRRFGENDATMNPEEKALQRFVVEKQRGNRKGAVFNLEDSEEEDDLTHFGKALSFEHPHNIDDFNEAGLGSSDDGNAGEVQDFDRPHKRRKHLGAEDQMSAIEDEDQVERQKTKSEVMKEVVSKSKLYKYERQQAKEDDDDLRAELDKGLPDLFALLRGNPATVSEGVMQTATPNPIGAMNPDRLALLNGKERSQADKEYDQRLRQMAMDQRAKPTVPSLTEEEKLARDAQLLRDLERRRLRRMKGEQDDSGSERVGREAEAEEDFNGYEEDEDTFGLGVGLVGQPNKQELGVEDEDDFILDDDLIASGSVDEASSEAASDSSGDGHGAAAEDEDEAEFVQGLFPQEVIGGQDVSMSGANAVLQAKDPKTDLAFTFPCPQTHRELLEVTKNISFRDLSTVVQRIRALYQPRLANDNKAKLGGFAAVLVDHISYIANQSEHPPFAVLEALIRHMHSLAKTFPEEVGRTFRIHLKTIHEDRPGAPTAGDLVILTAIGSIFPTSDHFHQVVTPAMLCMTRYLGQKIPSTLQDLATGTYISSLCLNYQRLSKRFIPEVVNYTLNAVYALSPKRSTHMIKAFPHHKLPESLQIQPTYQDPKYDDSQLDFWDTSFPREIDTSKDGQELKYALLKTQIHLAEVMADLWADVPAFCEILSPIHVALRFVSDKDKNKSGIFSSKVLRLAQEASAKVRKLLDQSLQARQPLRLHNHLPLAIKSSIPKFEESYNPDKHYDPDRDRAELSKLKAEHRKERKGALRELRKDANFMARESLKEKKERDSAYEKKYKRLVAEIQGEEGREAKLYEREKKMRKGKK